MSDANKDVTEKVVKDLVSASDGQLPAKAEPKIPVGHVERVLNYRDRNLLLGACQEYCSKDGRGNYKNTSKLDRISKLLLFQETVDYFAMIDESLEDALFKWQRSRNDWLSLQQYLGGGMTLEDLKKKAPAVDPQSPPKRPALTQPQATPEEMRGKDRSFYLPSKLDVFAQDALRAATWNPQTAEYVTELLARFEIKDED